MKKFIRQLRRREVFRTAGLYVGICWILIEVGSVVLPVFDAPEWILRGAIIAAVAGFPVMLVLAWFLDVSDKGISLEVDPTSTIVEDLGAKKADFIIIGVLVLALAVSLFLNVKSDAPVAEATQPISVLVSAIENTTGDQIFEDVLEEALIVGLEVAPHVSAYKRLTALDHESAREIATQEGIRFLFSGSLRTAGNGYRISVEAFDVSSNQSVFELKTRAASRDAVLLAVGDMALDARKQLGDGTVGDAQGAHAETFVAASLESASAYVAGKRYEIAGELDDAVRFYQQAIAADTNSGRALSSLALLEFERGYTDTGAGYWRRALPLLKTMTEREGLRALGRHKTIAAADEDAALALYADFVGKYPADVDACRNLAAGAFRQLDFNTAIDQSRNILQLYPQDTSMRTQLALYAMAASDWETASVEAERVISIDPDDAMAYVPLAMAAQARGQTEAARAAYQKMATAGETGRGASIAQLGLADIDLFTGDADAAQASLQAGIEVDVANGDQRMAALKSLALAGSYADQQNFPAAIAAAETGASLSDDLATRVLAAMVYVRADDVASVQSIADALAAQPGTHNRAYAKMLQGLILERQGAQTDAILSMRRAIAMADLWLIRFEIGKAYLRAGNYPEALGELATLTARNGEAAAAFMDAMPTYRLLAELPYWTGRVQEELNLRGPARASYEEYLALRSHGGALAEDARNRARSLD